MQATFAETGWIDAITASGRAAVALHLPGHGVTARMNAPQAEAATGVSPTSLAAHDPSTYSDLAGTLTSNLPSGSFDVVGFSLGAKIALELAVRFPGRIGRMVLGGIGDNVFAPERIAEAAARALESSPSAETPPPVLDFLRVWEPHRNDALAVAAVLRRPPNPVFTPDRLRGVTSPVLIVNGGADPVGRMAETLLRSLPNVTSMTLPDVGHFDLPQQAAFRRHALEFLQAQGAAS